MPKMNLKNIIIAVVLTTFAAACSPKVGSEAWCGDMKQKDKGQWTADEAANFAKHCLL